MKVAGLALLIPLLLPATAAAQFPGTGLTQLSDAPASNPAISQDKRFGRLVAFESGGNVYAVHRAEQRDGRLPPPLRLRRLSR